MKNMVDITIFPTTAMVFSSLVVKTLPKHSSCVPKEHVLLAHNIIFNVLYDNIVL